MLNNIDYESLALYGKFGILMLGLLLLIWVIALITPKLAGVIDKIMGKPADPSPERVEGKITAENYEVHSFFEDVPIIREKADNDTENNNGGN